MLVFPNAKINLGLNIVRKRSDGYHELETCFYPVPMQEALEIAESDETQVAVTGIAVPQDGENIVLKAYKSLKEDHNLPPVKIHLHKCLPIGAGLGGGSADGAFTLSALNKLFKLDLSDEELMNYAVKLGADCPFFIKNKPMIASGIGEKLAETDLSLKGKFMVLVYPNLHISTKEAYAGVIPQKRTPSVTEVITEYDISDWKKHLFNDFEHSLFKKYPILNQLKKQLYESGAMYASMSGSGSSIYGIFDSNLEINFFDNYKVWSGNF